MHRTVIGVVGPIASGKGEFLNQLKQRGFEIYSLSTYLRETSNAIGLIPTRKALQDIGDLLREHRSTDALAEITAGKILVTPHTRIAIDSLRHPDEIRTLQQHFPEINIVGVTASLEKQFELMQIRSREGDPTNWEEFYRAAQRDLGVGQAAWGQQVEACLQLAHPVLENNGTLEEWKLRVENTLTGLGIEGNRLPQEKK